MLEWLANPAPHEHRRGQPSLSGTPREVFKTTTDTFKGTSLRKIPLTLKTRNPLRKRTREISCGFKLPSEFSPAPPPTHLGLWGTRGETKAAPKAEGSSRAESRGREMWRLSEVPCEGVGFSSKANVKTKWFQRAGLEERGHGREITDEFTKRAGPKQL